MKTRKLVETFLSFIEGNRKTGNTRLILDGARNYDGKFLMLGWSQDHALEKCEGISNAKPLSIQNIESFKGTKLPIAIDPDVMGWLMGKVAYEFGMMELQLEKEWHKADSDIAKYRIVANELMTEAENNQKVLINRGELLMKIQTMSWWERIFLAPRLIRQLFLLELKNNQI